MTTAGFGPFGPGDSGDDRPPPYSDPPAGFWDTQPWRGAPAQPPSEDPLPPYAPTPEFHELQAERYENHALVQEAHTWHEQAAAGADVLDKRGLWGDRPAPQWAGALEHQQHSADHLTQQRWAETQAQQHRQSAQELRDPQRWSQYHDDQARLIDQQAAEHAQRSETYRAAGQTGAADLSQYRQHDLEAQAQQHRQRAEQLKSLRLGEHPDIATTRPGEMGEHSTVFQLPPDQATQSAQALRDYAHHQTTQADDISSRSRDLRDEAAARTGFAENEQRLAQQARDQLNEHERQIHSEKTRINFYTNKISRTRTSLNRIMEQSREQEKLARDAGEDIEHNEGYERYLARSGNNEEELSSLRKQLTKDRATVQAHSEQAQLFQEMAVSHQDAIKEDREKLQAAERALEERTEQAEHSRREVALHEQRQAAERQAARTLKERELRLAGQAPQLHERSRYNRQLADQYEAAAHPPAPAGLVVYDHAGIAEASRGLRRVISQSESTLDRIDEAQAMAAETSSGHTAQNAQAAYTQLRDRQRRQIDAATRALDYLDLADTRVGHLDDNLARVFFQI